MSLKLVAADYSDDEGSPGDSSSRRRSASPPGAKLIVGYDDDEEEEDSANQQQVHENDLSDSHSATTVGRVTVPGIAPASTAASTANTATARSNFDATPLIFDELPSCDPMLGSVGARTGPFLDTSLCTLDVDNVAGRPMTTDVERNVRRFLAVRESTGRNVNDELRRHKHFHNPTIYEKLTDLCGVDERGSNLPTEVYDPQSSLFGADSHYKQLGEQQSVYMETRAREMRQRTTVDFVPATALPSTASSSTTTATTTTTTTTAQPQNTAQALKQAVARAREAAASLKK